MFRVTRVLRADIAAQAKNAIKSTGKQRDAVLQKGAKRDPELYVRLLTTTQDNSRIE